MDGSEVAFFFFGDGCRAVLSEGCSAALLGLFSSLLLKPAAMNTPKPTPVCKIPTPTLPAPKGILAELICTDGSSLGPAQGTVLGH